MWSVFGRLPVSVSAGGMYMGRDGIHSVVAQAEGVVDEELMAKKGLFYDLAIRQLS